MKRSLLANESAAGRAMVGQGGNEFLSIIGSVSGFDRRCQGAGKIAGCPCLRSRIDSTPADEIEGGAVLNVAAEKERGARDECWKHQSTMVNGQESVSSEIIMALNRQHVGIAVYSVLCWHQCRPIRAGPASVFDGQ